MKSPIPKVPSTWIWGAAVVAVTIVGLITRGSWAPTTKTWVESTVASFRSAGEADSAAPTAPYANAAHDTHAGHNEDASLELSRQALRNVGLSAEQIRPIKLESFHKSITFPAVIVERPGRTRVQVATPMNGVIMQVHADQGEAVEPGTLLFRIRLTHEDLVQAQTNFVTTVGELDVEQREIERITEIASTGAVAGKVLLERQYAKDKLTALLRAQREALRLHGLSEQQVDQIAKTRRLLRELQIVVPSADAHGVEELQLSGILTRPVTWMRPAIRGRKSESAQPGPLILQTLDVHKGQSVMEGETLCVLANYGELFIEGKAFEQDIEQLRQASAHGWRVDAIFGQANSSESVVEGLEIVYLSNQIDTTSRRLRFYVRLPNMITKDGRADGNRFIEWKYLPGQRLQLRIPVEEWPNQIILPVDAVAREGAEYFVFQQNGDHFDRVAVHVKYRDQYSVVVESDGSLFPGDVLAMRGAHQLQMALKNKAGGGVDPHAGHNH